MLTNKDYCDYGLMVELEQLGMPIKIDFACSIGNGQLVKTKFYPNPPTLYEAQKFLREEKHLHIEVFFSLIDDKRQLHYDWHIVHNIRFDDDEYTYDCDVLDSMGSYKSYEEALSEGIKEAVKILTNNKNE